jgi:tetratricopeptide (TPR) repeat protein
MSELADGLRQALTLGRLYFLKKDYARAEQHLNQVVEQNQSFADVYDMLGLIYSEQGQYQKAERAFEAALRINPRYTDAALNLAVIYNDTGKYREAREIYRQALTHAEAAPGELDRFVKGKLANVYSDAGDVWLCAGKHGEAIGEYRRALALCPGFVDIRAKLAAALRDAGEREQALAEYQEIVRQAPSYVPARLALGVTLHALGKRDEAIREWEKVLELAPGNGSAETYLKLARSDGPGDRPRR